MAPVALVLLCLAGHAAAFAPARTPGSLDVRPPTAGAFAARPPALPAERRRSELSTQRRAVITALDGGEAATAAFLLFNAAYVGQIIVKPRQQADGDPYALLQVPTRLLFAACPSPACAMSVVEIGCLTMRMHASAAQGLEAYRASDGAKVAVTSRSALRLISFVPQLSAPTVFSPPP